MRARAGFLVLAVIVVIGALAAFWVTRGDVAKLPETAAIGASPTLPEPHKNIFLIRAHCSRQGVAAGDCATAGGGPRGQRRSRAA